MSAGNVLDIESVIALKAAYKRRLLQLNDQIRKLRKDKQETKHLNEKRKVVNKYYNLLEQLETKFKSTDQNQYQVYSQLLDIYKND